MRRNSYHLHIYSVEDLIAVWRYIKCNRFTRSVDFSRVPEEWRFSTAAFLAMRAESGTEYRGGPITYQELAKSQLSLKHVRQEMSTISCHHSGGRNSKWPDFYVHPKQVAGVLRNSGKVIPLILDVDALVRVCNEVGINGRVKYKIIDGHQYVIFTRAPFSSKGVIGVEYPTNHRKIIQLGIGRIGVKNHIAGGARLTIYLTVPLSVLDATLSDHGLMASLIGHLAVDLIKIGIATLMGYIFAVAFGGVVTHVAGPLIIAIFVGNLMVFGLDRVDSNYQLTNKLAAAIESYFEDISRSAKDSAVRTMNEGVRQNIHNRTFYSPLLRY